MFSFDPQRNGFQWHRLGISAVLVGLVLWFTFLAATAPAKETVRLSLLEYPPYISQHSKGYGIEPAIVTAAFQKVNIDVEYDFYPPARAIATARAGNNHGAVGGVWSKKREKSFYFSEPIFDGPLVFFHLKGSPFDWQSIDDLKGQQIGLVLKNFYGKPFHDAMDAGLFHVQYVPLDELNFDKLLYNRITLFPLNVHIGYHFIRTKYDAKTSKLFTHHPKPLKTSVYHVLFSRAVPGNESLMEAFNRGLRELRDSGEYAELVEAYDLGDK